MNQSIIVPTILTLVALGAVAYEHVQIKRMGEHIATVTSAQAPVETRLRALETRVTHAAMVPPSAPVPAAAVRDDGAETEAANMTAVNHSALSPADRLKAQAAAKEILAAAHASSLDIEQNRVHWIQQFGIDEGLSSAKVKQLGAVFETEFARRADVIKEVRAGVLTRKEGRAELQRLEATGNQEAKALLGAEFFDDYLKRRIAAGIHDE